MRSKIFNLFIWLFFPLFVSAQSSVIDSLEQLLDSSQDTVRLEVLDQLAGKYLERDLDKSLELSYQLLKEAEHAGYQAYICQAYSHIGTVHRQQNIRLDTVIQDFEKALTCCKAVEDSACRVGVLTDLAGLYQRNGFYVKALSHYQEALELAQQRNDTTKMLVCLGNIGVVLNSRNEPKKSLQYSKQALAYAKILDHPLYVSKISNNMAISYLKQEKYDAALGLYEESLAIKREVGSEISLVTTLANIGRLWTIRQQCDRAQPYLDEAYAIAQRHNYPYGLGFSLKTKAENKRCLQEYQEAIQLSYEGLAVIGQQGDLTHIGDFYWVLSTSYEQLNMPDSALLHYKSYQIFKDSIYESEKENQIQQLEISYQVKQREIENQLLKTEQSYIQEELSNRTYQSIGLIIALFLACGWGVAVYRNNQAKKRMNYQLEVQVAERTEDLETANEQLQQANYELKTFNYIASHDIKEPIRNIGNYVSLIHRRLPDELKGDMQDYFLIIKQSTNQLYTLIEDFASYTSLSKDGVTAQKEVDLQTLVSSIEIGLASFIAERNGELVYEQLPRIYSHSSLLFVALKNLIENGLKFNTSELPRVEITYEETERHHRIMVSDNGIGIDPQYHERIFIMFKRLHNRAEYVGSGIGLALVSLIMKKLEGDVRVESELDLGSTFVLRFPK